MQEEKGAPPKNKEALDEFYGGKSNKLNGSAVPTLPPEASSKLMIFPAITVCNLNMFKVLVLTEEDWYQTAHKLFDMVDETGEFVEPNTISKYRRDRTQKFEIFVKFERKIWKIDFFGDFFILNFLSALYFKGESAKNLQKAVQRIKAEYSPEKRKKKRRRKKRSTGIDSKNSVQEAILDNILRRKKRQLAKKEPRETVNSKPSRNFEIPKTSVQQIMVEKPRNPRTRLPIIKEWNMLDFINRTGFHKDDILLECKFRGTDCKEDKFWKTVSIWKNLLSG